MGSPQRKAEKHRKRRQERRREFRNSTARRERACVADIHPIHACLVNAHWRDDGLASILFARRVAPGHVTTALFLVDHWGMGLKDAWGRIAISDSEQDELLGRFRSQFEVATLNPRLALHLVHGGIELARELGFRLPRKFERWTGILGPLPGGEVVDRSLFGVDGKHRIVCNERDLKARLIGCTVQQLLARQDVEYSVETGSDFTLVDDEADEFDDAVSRLAHGLIQEARQWCFAHREIPHPHLPTVVHAAIDAVTQVVMDDTDDSDATETDTLEPDDLNMESLDVRVMSLLAHETQSDPAGLQVAMAQFGAFIASTDGPSNRLMQKWMAHGAS